MVDIVTERLLLRCASQNDAAPFHRILSNPTAMEFWSTPPHRDMIETEKWVSDMARIDPQVGEDFVIERQAQVIGKAGLYRFPEVGFILHPDAWGYGYAQEALRPVLDRALTVHRLPAVDADVDPDNVASLHVLTRLGFKEVGRARRTWDVGGQWRDSVYLRLENMSAR